jgi:Virulence activator alpha C-term
VLSQSAGSTDRMGLLNRQRRHYLSQMRGLASLAETASQPIARLLIEGAMLHLQADIDWLQRCQEELL